MTDQTMSLSNFITQDTINIFTDASVASKCCYNGTYSGCYGAIAVIGEDTVADEIYRISSYTTNNNSEIKGIRAGVELALKYRNMFQNINIFSDSQISVFGIRDRLVHWKINTYTNTMYTKQGTKVQSEEIYMQIVYTILRYNLRCTFWHQKGHVSNSFSSLQEAQHTFEASNEIRCKTDLNLIRFISKWNNVVDDKSRRILQDYDRSKRYEDPVKFLPDEFDKRKYNELIQNNLGMLP